MADVPKQKSWKREIAGAMLLFWASLVWKVFHNVPAEHVAEYGGVLSGITIAIVPSCMAVFITHHVVKKD